jgi:hypothetical protein
MSLDLTADERSELAAEVAAELDTGRYGERFVLSRRQLLSIAGGVGGVAGLTALGVDPAAAQSAAGQVGTSSEPVDVEAYDVTVSNLLNGGGPISDGDGTERQLWIVANGAGDPSGADPEDLIAEEEA